MSCINRFIPIHLRASLSAPEISEHVNRVQQLIKDALDAFGICKGTQGDKGDPGATGAAGAAGATGATGASGGWQLALSYGFKGSSGTLPPAEGPGVFWLKPDTWDDISVVYSEPISDIHAPTEWEVGGTYSKVRLDIFVTDCNGLPAGGSVLNVVVTKNGADTAAAEAFSAETVTRHDTGAVSVSFSDGDRVGVLVRYVGAHSWNPAGSLWMTVKVTLS